MESVIAEGDDFDDEVINLSLSTSLARGILARDPALATNEAELLSNLKTRFPIVTDISDAEMLQAIEDILQLQSTRPGKMPCALIVLDELQQYVGSDTDRSSRLGVIVEKCCSHFGSRLLFVGTGQSALEVSPSLGRLKDRFTVKVELSDTDVDSVVREVVLRGSGIADMQGRSVQPATARGVPGKWTMVLTMIGSVEAGKSISQILLVFDNDHGDSGHATVAIGGIEIGEPR